MPGYGGFSRQVVDSARQGRGGGEEGIHYSFGNVKPKAGIRRMRADKEKTRTLESRLTTPSCNVVVDDDDR